MPPESLRPGDTSESRTSDGRRRVGLLALGSAAVLSIYAAGFVRTRAAASRLDDAEAVRHPIGQQVRSAPADTVVTPRIVPTPLALRGADSLTVPASRVSGRASRASATPAKVAPPRPITDSTSVGAGRSVEAVAVAPVTAEILHEPPVPIAEAQPQIAPPTPATQQAQYKDGSYVGWGTSRHGDIEATVEIKGGRIISAEISDCRTRYSCSRIAALPPQVLAKQGAEVDYVSGATQSSDAYYYAVVDALKKAK